MSYFYDLHCHTKSSSCSIASIEDIVKMAKKRGVDGVAITDHNKLYKGPKHIDGIDIIPGVEISFLGEEHLLAYYVGGEIKRGQTLKKTVKEVKEKGGYAVWAHPLREEDRFNKDVLEVISLLDGLESGNAMNTKKEQKLIDKKAKQESLLRFAGSDMHMEGQLGMAVVKVSNRLNKDNFLKEIKNSEIIIREEIIDFRERNRRWKKFMGFNKRMLNAEKYQFIKDILIKVFLRNFLRLNNTSLKKVEFNYKDMIE